MPGGPAPRLAPLLALALAAACFQDAKSVTTAVSSTAASESTTVDATTTTTTTTATTTTTTTATAASEGTTTGEGSSTTAAPEEVVVAVADAENDALQDPDTSMKVLFGWTTLNSPNHWGGLRFALPAIPQGATIVDAEFQVYVDGDDTDSPRAEIYGQLDPNPPVFSELAGDLSGRPRTKASVLWSADDVGAGWTKSPSLVSVIQELVDQEGWAPGHHIVLILDATPAASNRVPFEYRQWDLGPEVAPILGIRYLP